MKAILDRNLLAARRRELKEAKEEREMNEAIEAVDLALLAHDDDPTAANERKLSAAEEHLRGLCFASMLHQRLPVSLEKRLADGRPLHLLCQGEQNVLTEIDDQRFLLQYAVSDMSRAQGKLDEARRAVATREFEFKHAQQEHERIQTRLAEAERELDAVKKRFAKYVNA